MVATPKVWVVNTGQHDYSPASKFGVITPIFRGRMDVFDSRAIIEDMLKMLNKHAQADDYIVYSGFTFLNSLVSHYFFKRFGKIQCLIFMNKSNDYRPMTVYDFETPKA